MKEDLFCPCPFRTIMLNSDHVYRVCCNNPGFPHLNSSTVTAREAFHSKEFESIRQNLKNGIRDPHCQKCWSLEDRGAESLRLQELSHEDFDKDALLESPQIEQMFLGLGNQCNLKCRTCSPAESSMWVNEIKDTEGIQHVVYLEPDNGKFLSDLKESVLPYLKEINFTGGEPSILKSTKRILEILNPSVAVSIVTNGTNKLPDALNKFDDVEIFLSIDGIEKRFNYLRHPGNWIEVKNHVELIKFKKTVCCTISAYNVFYINEVEEFANSIGAEFYCHILYEPQYLSTHVIPKEIRKEICEKLSIDSSTQKEKIIAHLQEDNYLNWNAFVGEVNKRDAIRGENFKETFPEFYAILEQHGKTI